MVVFNTYDHEREEEKRKLRELALLRHVAIGRPSDSLVKVFVRDFNLAPLPKPKQIWTIGRAIKPTTCCICFEEINRKASVYRPITNGRNRADRAHKQCMENIDLRPDPDEV